MKLKGKIALITGASRGIGAAVASQLSADGAYTIGTATTAKGALGINQRLSAGPEGGKGMVLDVSDAGSIATLMQSLSDAGHRISILVNNAAITRDNLLVRMSDQDWDAVIETDLTSVFRLSRHVLRAMIKAREGRIINVTSVVGYTGNAGQVNYAAAKAGIVGFTRSLARELGSRGITVNAVAPGFIDTDMTGALSDGQKQALLDQIPLRRLGEVDDIAQAVAFLASDAAAYITGQTLHVNGGLYLG